MKCQREYGGVSYIVDFEVDMLCIVTNGSQRQEATYDILLNRYASGAYANNDVSLKINVAPLRDHSFWCSTRGENWGPIFVQCWKHETDFVLEPITKKVKQ